MRTPSVLVSVRISRSSAALSAGLHSTVSSVPGRPFFMITGVSIASSAPRASAVSATYASTCGDRSSSAVSSTVTVSQFVAWDFSAIASGSHLSPTLIRSTLGKSFEFRVPAPYPIRSTRIAGCGPKTGPIARSSAAPVGVTSSCSTCAE